MQKLHGSRSHNAERRPARRQSTNHYTDLKVPSFDELSTAFDIETAARAQAYGHRLIAAIEGWRHRESRRREMPQSLFRDGVR